MSRSIVASAFYLMTIAAAMAGENPVSVSIERALPYLEEEGTWWIEKKKCPSCHHTTFLVWAKDLALESGFAVDQSKLEEQRKWVWDFFLSSIPPDPKNPDANPDPKAVRGDRNVEGVSQLLVSTSTAFLPEKVEDTLREIIISNQGTDGKRKPGGQLPLQARDLAETQLISRQWAMLALDENEAPAAHANRELSDVPAKTSEWYAMNAVLYPNQDSISKILKRQNEDGGWSWMDGESSSPTATGQALFALGRTGVAKVHHEAAERARQYLLNTQLEDGHWETKSTKNREESARTSNFWGTAWSVIGLLESEK